MVKQQRLKQQEITVKQIYNIIFISKRYNCSQKFRIRVRKPRWIVAIQSYHLPDYACASAVHKLNHLKNNSPLPSISTKRHEWKCVHCNLFRDLLHNLLNQLKHGKCEKYQRGKKKKWYNLPFFCQNVIRHKIVKSRKKINIKNQWLHFGKCLYIERKSRHNLRGDKNV